jgi:hypothetical protein
MLISMPTGTSTIVGAFQAIWLSFLKPRDLQPSDKVMPNENYASEIFPRGTPRGLLLHREKPLPEQPPISKIPAYQRLLGVRGPGPGSAGEAGRIIRPWIKNL